MPKHSLPTKTKWFTPKSKTFLIPLLIFIALIMIPSNHSKIDSNKQNNMDSNEYEYKYRNKLKLDLNIRGQGSLLVNGSKYNQNSSLFFDVGDKVEVEAVPNINWEIYQWLSTPMSITTSDQFISESYFIIQSNSKISASFKPIEKEMIKILQSEINTIGYTIQVDGIIGSETKSTLNKAFPNFEFDLDDGLDYMEYQRIIREIDQKRTDIENRCPLEFVSCKLKTDTVGVPYLYIRVKNISDKTIDAYIIQTYFYDRWGNPCNHYLKHTNVFTGNSNEIIDPNNLSPSNRYWYLHGYESITEIEAEVIKVHFQDGSIWEPHYINNTYYEELGHWKQ